MRITSTSPNMTRRIAARLARLLRAGDLLALSGPLGAGKTCFVQGLAEGLGLRQVVSSPSFVLAKHYPGPVGLLHVDAYRLETPEEFWDLGLQEQTAESVAAVEWAERVDAALPEERIDAALGDAGGDRRTIELTGRGARPAEIVAVLGERLATDGDTDG
ncbi:MAG: tRNA (adenosine(37)-N6)-threonylcarbamoyltransferase complex ATPase subunit type 1 TsaE [Armatimonadetes bacterium]|nr:tRNA (adenosine(37)-N6)-threonylcarbamoyltransferase complex ATPase subunit type 1 TsaE [Armatimonadota bacterium]